RRRRGRGGSGALRRQGFRQRDRRDRKLTMPAQTKKQLNPFLKLTLEMGPLVLFFFANSRPALFMPLVGPLLPQAASGEKAGIFVATAVFLVALFVALAGSYALTRHLPVMAMVTAIVVLVFGSLTLVLHDDTF